MQVYGKKQLNKLKEQVGMARSKVHEQESAAI